MGQSFRIVDGNVTATISGELEDLVRRSSEALLPGVLAAMEVEARKVLAAAEAEWPVRTGVSRAGLELVTTADFSRKTVGVQIRNDVDYAIYVRHTRSTAWQQLVRGPMEVARAKVVDDLGPVILHALKAA